MGTETRNENNETREKLYVITATCAEYGIGGAVDNTYVLSDSGELERIEICSQPRIFPTRKSASAAKARMYSKYHDRLGLCPYRLDVEKLKSKVVWQR